MSDTPRTENAVGALTLEALDEGIQLVPADFARALERELAEEKSGRESARKTFMEDLRVMKEYADIKERELSEEKELANQYFAEAEQGRDTISKLERKLAAADHRVEVMHDGRDIAAKQSKFQFDQLTSELAAAQQRIADLEEERDAAVLLFKQREADIVESTRERDALRAYSQQIEAKNHILTSDLQHAQEWIERLLAHSGSEP